MGWANCGTDSKGRPIGYAHDGTCDHPSCLNGIHRGLEYACGDMHGETEIGCEGYFCYEHISIEEGPDGTCQNLCPMCAEQNFEAIKELEKLENEEALKSINIDDTVINGSGVYRCCLESVASKLKTAQCGDVEECEYCCQKFTLVECEGEHKYIWTPNDQLEEKKNV